MHLCGKEEIWIVTWLVLEPRSTAKDYIRAENKLQSICSLFIPQVIIPQVSFAQTTTQILTQTQKNSNMVWSLIFRGHSTWETSIQPGDRLVFRGPTQKPVFAAANAGKTLERFFGKVASQTRRGICTGRRPGTSAGSVEMWPCVWIHALRCIMRTRITEGRSRQRGTFKKKQISSFQESCSVTVLCWVR